MGTILVAFGDAADDHEGYAGQVLDDGTITAVYSNDTEPRMVGAVVAACGCGWRGTTHYPTKQMFDSEAENLALNEWEHQHARPVLCALTPEHADPTIMRTAATTEDTPTNPALPCNERPTLDLPAAAAEVSRQLAAHGFSTTTAVQRQVLALAEEVGEFVGAYRRWSGQARRRGSAQDMHAELADVVITAYVTAHELGMDLDQAISDKVAVVFSRGWREQADTPTAADRASNDER